MIQRVMPSHGRLQTGASLALAGTVAGVVATSSPVRTDVAARLVLAGVALLALALALGAARLVGVATVPVLGGALMASIAAGEPTWVRSIVLGCIWYIAAELAWDAIERRDAAVRSRGLDTRRIHEVATVLTLSLAATSAGFLLSSFAPVRSMLNVGLVVLGLLVALIVATRHLADSPPDLETDPPDQRRRQVHSNHL